MSDLFGNHIVGFSHDEALKSVFCGILSFLLYVRTTVNICNFREMFVMTYMYIQKKMYDPKFDCSFLIKRQYFCHAQYDLFSGMLNTSMYFSKMRFWFAYHEPH